MMTTLIPRRSPAPTRAHAAAQGLAPAQRETAEQPPRFVSIAHVLAIMARARRGPTRTRIVVSYAPSHLPPLLQRRSRAGLTDGCDESSALLMELVRRLLAPADQQQPPTARPAPAAR